MLRGLISCRNLCACWQRYVPEAPLLGATEIKMHVHTYSLKETNERDFSSPVVCGILRCSSVGDAGFDDMTSTNGRGYRASLVATLHRGADVVSYRARS